MHVLDLGPRNAISKHGKHVLLCQSSTIQAVGRECLHESTPGAHRVIHRDRVTVVRYVTRIF